MPPVTSSFNFCLQGGVLEAFQLARSCSVLHFCDFSRSSCSHDLFMFPDSGPSYLESRKYRGCLVRIFPRTVLRYILELSFLHLFSLITMRSNDPRARTRSPAYYDAGCQPEVSIRNHQGSRALPAGRLGRDALMPWPGFQSTTTTTTTMTMAETRRGKRAGIRRPKWPARNGDSLL